MPTARGGQLGRLLDDLVERGRAGELVLRLERRLPEGLKAHEVRLTRQEHVVAERAAGQERRQLRAVPRLLGGPERPGLRQLPLPLLGEGVGDGVAYRLGVRRGAGGGDAGKRLDGAIPAQLVAQLRDLSAQTPDVLQGGDADGRGSGRGEHEDTYGGRHGAH